MTPRPKVPAVLACALLAGVPLGGCATFGAAETVAVTGAAAGAAYLVGKEAEVEDWHNVTPAKTLRVTPTEMVHHVRFPAGGADLHGTEMAALDDFLRRVRPGRADRVEVVADPTPLARRRAEAVTGYLARAGVPPRLAVDRTRPSSATVAVRVRRHVVTLPACPDWSDEAGNTHSNSVTSNWGCATASNLGLMVADPRDLMEGREMGPADGGYVAAGIARYRAGETTPIAILNTGAVYTFSKSEGE